MVKPYKIRDTYKIRKIISSTTNQQFGITIPSFLLPEWSGAEVKVYESGTNAIVLERKK